MAEDYTYINARLRAVEAAMPERSLLDWYDQSDLIQARTSEVNRVHRELERCEHQVEQRGQRYYVCVPTR